MPAIHWNTHPGVPHRFMYRCCSFGICGSTDLLVWTSHYCAILCCIQHANSMLNRLKRQRALARASRQVDWYALLHARLTHCRTYRRRRGRQDVTWPEPGKRCLTVVVSASYTIYMLYCRFRKVHYCNLGFGNVYWRRWRVQGGQWAHGFTTQYSSSCRR